MVHSGQQFVVVCYKYVSLFSVDCHFSMTLEVDFFQVFIFSCFESC